MSTSTVYYSTTIVAVTCGDCGVPFGLPASMKSARLEDGRNFYCPNGHKICYGQNENEQLRRDLAAEQQQRKFAEARAKRIREEKEATERSLRSTKGQVTKLKKRAAAGTCAFCNRTFQNVTAHMERQHPEHIHAVREATHED